MGSHTSRTAQIEGSLPVTFQEQDLDQALLQIADSMVTAVQDDALENSIAQSPPSTPLTPKKKGFLKNKLTTKLFSLEQKLSPSPPASPKLNRFRDGKAYPEKRNMSVSNFVTSAEVIGEGAFAKVRIATHKHTGLKVAVKSFAKSARMTKEQCNDLMMIRREKDILLTKFKDHHPNIIQFYTFAESESSFNIYMQYVEGGDMFGWLCAKRQVEESLCKRLFVQMLDAVDYCHKQGICHRDIKLENFLLETIPGVESPRKTKKKGAIMPTQTLCKYRPILIDFGFATPIPQDGIFRNFPGSPSYACPSILQGKPYNGVSADVYALGVTLYTMVYGRYPFYDEDNTEFYRQICEDEPTFSRYQGYVEGHPTLSKDLIHLMESMLIKDNYERITIAGIRNHPWLSEVRPIPPPRNPMDNTKLPVTSIPKKSAIRVSKDNKKSPKSPFRVIFNNENNPNNANAHPTTSRPRAQTVAGTTPSSPLKPKNKWYQAFKQCSPRHHHMMDEYM